MVSRVTQLFAICDLLIHRASSFMPGDIEDSYAASALLVDFRI